VKELVPTEDINFDDKKRPTTAGTSFQNQVAALMKALYACNPHYIRCVKPNAHKQPLIYDVALTTDQVKYLGLFENVRVRRAGYAYRQTFEKFLNRYKMLTKETWPKWKGDPKEGCKVILNYLQGNKKEGAKNPFQFGKTKVFIRNPDWIYSLEELRLRALHEVIKRVQAVWRAYQIRKYYLELRAASLGIFEGKKERRRQSVNIKFFGDYLGLQDNRTVKVLFSKYTDKKVLFSAHVNKVNTNLKVQPRALLISDTAFYNLDPKKFSFKRRLEIKNISGLSLSSLCDGFIIIHMKEPDYDYIAAVDKKTEVVTVLLSSYNKLTNGNLNIKFADKIEFRARKGKREITFTKGSKDSTNKKSKTLQVTVDSSNLASPSDFAAILEYIKIKNSSSQPAQPNLIVRKEKAGGSSNSPRAIPKPGFGTKTEPSVPSPEPVKSAVGRSPSVSNKFCRHCGVVPSGGKFCSSCGGAL